MALAGLYLMLLAGSSLVYSLIRNKLPVPFLTYSRERMPWHFWGSVVMYFGITAYGLALVLNGLLPS